MDMSPRPLCLVSVKGEPDETSLKTEMVDFTETIIVPDSPEELKYSPSMDLYTQPFCPTTVKSELEEVDTDLSIKTSPITEVEDSKENIIRELVPELPEELKYSPPVDLSADPFSLQDVKIETEEMDTDLLCNNLPRTEEEDLNTEMPDDIVNGNSSDGTSPNCASYSLPSSSGGVWELPTIRNLCTSKDEIIAPYLCSWCKSRFRNKCQLRTHLHCFHKIKSEDVIFSCSVCDKIYLKRTEFMKHILELHPGVNIHICPVCKETFHASWDLHEHLSEYKDNGSYLCATCGELFPTRSTLEAHMKVEEEYTSRPCETCGQMFPTRSTLEQHMMEEQHTSRPKVRVIEFYKDSAHNQHIKTNTEEILTCDVCAKSFSDRQALSEHISSHSDDDHLDCPRCEEKFATQSSLLAHLRAHRSRPHRCGTCNKTFSRQFDLFSHVTTHADGPSFRCSECRKCFTKWFDLKRHQSIHMEGRTLRVRWLPKKRS